MKRMSSYNYIRTSAVMIALAFAIISTTGCGNFCFTCLTNHGHGTKNENAIKQRQEILAKSQNDNTNKTGMILSFDAQDKKSSVPDGGYKDLSIHYKFEEKETCPLGLDGAHSNFIAGPNISFKNAGDDVYENGSHKPGIGFQAGFRTVYRFSDKFSVVPGILVKQNNAKEEAEITDGGEPPYNTSYKIEDKYSYTYLSAPILAQLNLTDDITVSAGPEINYLLSAKVKTNTSMAGQDHSEKRNISDESVRLGVGVQVGLKYQVPNSRWAMELVYDHRLSRLNKKHPDGYPNYTVPGWKMKSVQLGVSCRVCDLIKGPKHEKGVVK